MSHSPSVDAVTVDGFGTIVQLRDPISNLDIALRLSGEHFHTHFTLRYEYRPLSSQTRSPE